MSSNTEEEEVYSGSILGEGILVASVSTVVQLAIFSRTQQLTTDSIIVFDQHEEDVVKEVAFRPAIPTLHLPLTSSSNTPHV